MEVFKHLVFTGKVISLEQESLLPLKNLLEIRGPFVICFFLSNEFEDLAPLSC